MPTVVEELSARARTLPLGDRARLVEELLDSIQEEGEGEGEDADAEAAWDAQIRQRVAEVEGGGITLVPSDVVHEEARRLIHR